MAILGRRKPAHAWIARSTLPPQPAIVLQRAYVVSFNSINEAQRRFHQKLYSPTVKRIPIGQPVPVQQQRLLSYAAVQKAKQRFGLRTNPATINRIPIGQPVRVQKLVRHGFAAREAAKLKTIPFKTRIITNPDATPASSVGITTQAGDTATFRSLGNGIWRCENWEKVDGTFIVTAPITKGGTGQVTAVTAIDALHTAAADVPSAATVNLDTATGQVVTITGSVTITAFTLANGKVRRCRFSGGPKLTYSSSLLTPGVADIQGAANDTFEVVGKAGGVVEIRNYARAFVSPPVSNIYAPTVRLSLSNATPITTAATSAQSIIYCHPFNGASIPLYNGVEWTPFSLTNGVISIKLVVTTITGNTTNGSAVVTGLSADPSQLNRGMGVSGTGISGGTTIASIDSATQITLSANATATNTGTALTFKAAPSTTLPFDIFAVIFNNAPQLRLVPWTNDTTRAQAVSTITGLGQATGLWTNTSNINATDYNTISAHQGLYLGSVYVSDGATYDDQTQSASNGAKRWLWNLYNRRIRKFKVVDTTNSWTYSTASYQQANASGNNQVSFMIGLDEDPVEASLKTLVNNSTSTARTVAVGIGLDSTSGNSADEYDSFGVDNASRRVLAAVYNDYPGIGYHYLAWLEQGAGTADTQTWYGDNGGALVQTGMNGHVFG